jgi:hypothetical protein
MSDHHGQPPNPRAIRLRLLAAVIALAAGTVAAIVVILLVRSTL